MDFILQVCKVEEKDLVHLCDVGKSFTLFLHCHVKLLNYLLTRIHHNILC